MTIDTVLSASDLKTETNKQPLVTSARDLLHAKYASRIVINLQLDRTLVSYQASKRAAFYGWFKYKEGFSPTLVEYLLKQLWVAKKPGVMLDPFAGSGSALFAARARGWETRGIEVLPVGREAIKARLKAEAVSIPLFRAAVQQVLATSFSQYNSPDYALNHIPITRGAFPANQEAELNGYLTYCRQQIANPAIQELLLHAGFCVLEAISYTRKDGQYLRWDYRSGRSQGKKVFDKGPILTFRQAIGEKLNQIAQDLEGTKNQYTFDFDDDDIINTGPTPEIYAGSCLDVLPETPASSIDLVITSPPYCNRYDYTRTYALELVYLGCSNEQVKGLRQTMLSCTVENQAKVAYLQQAYAKRGQSTILAEVTAAFKENAALQEVLAILHQYKEENKLNNTQIAKMVQNYFYEMCFVIYELSRVLKPGGKIVIVNDNVRYAGEEVPVDLILSEMAETFGLRTSVIWTLERGKGNSSQQMGNHGRSELRKCIYVWEKSA